MNGHDMTDERFVASNGIEVAWERDVDGNLGLAVDGMYAVSAGRDYDALREFIVAEEDERLGRWRWPENPDYVVYRDHAAYYIDQPAVIVVNETTGGSAYAVTGSISASGVGACDDEMLTAVQDYFDAHPEPKPWHDAKPGEVWALTIDGHTFPWGVGSGVDLGKFIYMGGESNIPLTWHEITAGRRIWPVE